MSSKGNDAKSFVDRYADPKESAEETETNVHPISGEFQCFGVAKSNRMPPAMLVLRLKTGNQKALMYSYLKEIDFDPSEGIVLQYVSHRVTIRGRNLTAVFDRLVEHRITWLQEVDEALVADETATVVSTVQVEGH